MSTPSIKRAASFLGPSGSMAEVTYDPERSPRLQWLVQVGLNGHSAHSVRPILSLSGGGVAYDLAPPADAHDLVGKHIILLPSRLPENDDSTPGILRACSDWILRYCDIPGFWASLIAHYVLMSWVYDRFSAVPYLRFLGEPQTGKTRMLMCAAHLCYRSVICSGATSVSAIFRLLDIWQGTMVIDEADFSHADMMSEIIKVLNTSYQRDSAVLRSEKSGTTYDPTGFACFGPKILSTRSAFQDPATETRCLTLQTSDSVVGDHIPRQLPPEFYLEAQELRNRLLGWRLANFSSVALDQSALLHLPPRVGQIAIPLWSISPSAEFKLDLLEFLSASAREQRESSPEAVLAEGLRRLTFNFRHPSQWDQKMTIRELSEVCAQVAEERGEEQKWTAKFAGGILRGSGIVPVRGSSGAYEFSISKFRMDELLARHKSA